MTPTLRPALTARPARTNLKFDRVDVERPRKTITWRVSLIDTTGVIGTVKWHSNWHEYTFWSDESAMLNADTLLEIYIFLHEQNEMYKRQRAKQQRLSGSI